MKTSVREASLNDIDWIRGELKKFSDFFATEYPIYGGDEHAGNFMSWLIEKHVVFVSEQDKKLTGFIAGTLDAHPFNKSLTQLTEIFWWVNEEFRGSPSGTKLLEEFLSYGKEHANWIVCTLEDESPISDDVFLRRGFRAKERSFLLEV